MEEGDGIRGQAHQVVAFEEEEAMIDKRIGTIVEEINAPETTDALQTEEDNTGTKDANAIDSIPLRFLLIPNYPSCILPCLLNSQHLKTSLTISWVCLIYQLSH